MIYMHYLSNKTVRLSNNMIEPVILLYVESWWLFIRMNFVYCIAACYCCFVFIIVDVR